MRSERHAAPALLIAFVACLGAAERDPAVDHHTHQGLVGLPVVVATEGEAVGLKAHVLHGHVPGQDHR